MLLIKNKNPSKLITVYEFLHDPEKEISNTILTVCI